MSNKIIDWAVGIFTDFHYGSNMKKKINDLVYQNGDNIVWSFHGNILAKHNTKENTLTLTLSGWPSKSTMTRLNALLQAFGVKGNPFSGYSNTRFAEHPKFCGTGITSTEEIVIKLSEIPTGVYNYE